MKESLFCIENKKLLFQQLFYHYCFYELNFCGNVCCKCFLTIQIMVWQRIKHQSYGIIGCGIKVDIFGTGTWENIEDIRKSSNFVKWLATQIIIFNYNFFMDNKKFRVIHWKVPSINQFRLVRNIQIGRRKKNRFSDHTTLSSLFVSQHASAILPCTLNLNSPKV